MSNMNYTQEEISKIATNYVLDTTHTQVLKITRSEINENGVAIVNVRCYGKFTGKFTTKVYIAIDGCVSGDYGYRKVESLLTGEYENPDLGGLEKQPKLSKEEKAELKAKADAEKAIAKEKKVFEDFVKSVQGNVNYVTGRKFGRNGSQRIAGVKRSIKRHGVEKLESILSLLDETAQNFVQTCINEILEKEETADLLTSIVNRTKKFSPVLEGVLDQIENSVKEFEDVVYENILKWIRSDKDHAHYSTERQTELAKDYVLNQKARLMYAAVRYLGGLDIKEVANSTIRNHRNGFEGTWVLTLADGSTKIFNTNTIIAEGYIQRPHYRYLVNLK
jgi:hypothetical protein